MEKVTNTFKPQQLAKSVFANTCHCLWYLLLIVVKHKEVLLWVLEILLGYHMKKI